MYTDVYCCVLIVNSPVPSNMKLFDGGVHYLRLSTCPLGSLNGKFDLEGFFNLIKHFKTEECVPDTPSIHLNFSFIISQIPLYI